MKEQAVQAVADSELSLIQWLAKFLSEADMFLWAIIVMWAVGMGIIVHRWFKLKKYEIDAPSFMAEIKQFVLNNQIHLAIQLSSRTTALLPRVFKEALKRSNQSRQQIQDIVEAGMISAQGKVEDKLNWLALFGNFATLFGLLGTIHGLIITFGAVAGLDPSEKARMLSLGIAHAMNATATGILAAICLLFFHLVLSNKAHKIMKEIDEYAMRLIDLIGTRKNEEYENEDHVA
jgi:biopolymer transport protein ExbB/TolQ